MPPLCNTSVTNAVFTVNSWNAQALFYTSPTTFSFLQSSSTTLASSNYWQGWPNAGTAAQWVVYDERSAIQQQAFNRHVKNLKGNAPAAPAAVSEETRRRMVAEREAHEEQLRQYTREKRAKEEEVRKRARALLMQSLTRDQQRSLEERSYFDLNVGGKQYRIRQGTHGNVRLVEGGREVRSFCAQPDDVPAEDAMLAQKLMLETDEAAFLRVANARQLTA